MSVFGKYCTWRLPTNSKLLLVHQTRPCVRVWPEKPGCAPDKVERMRLSKLPCKPSELPPRLNRNSLCAGIRNICATRLPVGKVPGALPACLPVPAPFELGSKCSGLAGMACDCYSEGGDPPLPSLMCTTVSGAGRPLLGALCSLFGMRFLSLLESDF